MSDSTTDSFETFPDDFAAAKKHPPVPEPRWYGMCIVLLAFAIVAARLVYERRRVKA